MATTLTQDRQTTAHYIKSESNMDRSREAVVIASGAGILKAGTVLGQITASKKYTIHDPAAEDGSETAKAVLFEGCDATSADVRRTITARDAEVVAEALIWVDGISDNNKNTALAALAALGIIAR